jgi:hypothetical protein
MKKTTVKIAPKIEIKRTPSQHGKWVFKPLKSHVVTCSCGNKYIVTRDKQTQCVSCMYQSVKMAR